MRSATLSRARSSSGSTGFAMKSSAPASIPARYCCFPATHRDQNEVDVRLARSGADAAAQLRPVHLGHVPVGDHDGHARQLEQLPRLAAVRRAPDLVPGAFEARPAGRSPRVIVHDQHGKSR